MRLSALVIALGALTAVSATAATNKDTLVARSGPGGLDESARMQKRQIVHNNHLKKHRKRGTCKPKAAPSSAPPQFVAEPVKTGPAAPAAEPEPTKAAPQVQVPAKQAEQKPEQKPEPQPQPPAPPAPPANNNNNNGGGSSGSADAKLGGVSAFHGVNGPGIMSWFRTNLGSDHTNGESWCETRYKDDWMCFAPSHQAMMSNFGYDRVKAGKAYCGREAIIEYNGKQTKAFICDAFDDKWIRKPGSIDVTTRLFETIYGSFNGDKSVVGQDVKWWYTGGVVEQGQFQKGRRW